MQRIHLLGLLHRHSTGILRTCACVIKSNGSFWSYSWSDPESFQSYSLSVGLYRPGSFQSDFRGGSFLPNFGGSFRPISFYTVLIGNKNIFWLVRFILCSFIDNKSFSGLTYFLARFTDLFYLEILKHIFVFLSWCQA